MKINKKSEVKYVTPDRAQQLMKKWGGIFDPLMFRDENCLMEEIQKELKRARKKFPSFKSQHEGYAVILEELDELWDNVKTNKRNDARKEAIQVAAMAMRFILDT
jgi:hypothetical protein